MFNALGTLQCATTLFKYFTRRSPSSASIDWTRQLQEATDGTGPDIIYESVGGDITAKNLANLAPGGEIANDCFPPLAATMLV